MSLENLESRCVVFMQFLSLSFFFFFFFISNIFVCCVCVVRKHPKLKSKYKRHVKAATEYAKMIDNFDDLVDLRTLTHHCLGPEPSPFRLVRH